MQTQLKIKRIPLLRTEYREFSFPDYLSEHWYFEYKIQYERMKYRLD